MPGGGGGAAGGGDDTKDRAGGGDDMKDRVISHGAKQEDQDASRVNAVVQLCRIILVDVFAVKIYSWNESRCSSRIAGS